MPRDAPSPRQPGVDARAAARLPGEDATPAVPKAGAPSRGHAGTPPAETLASLGGLWFVPA